MMSKSNPYQEVDNSLLSIQPWPHLQQKQKQQLLPAVLLPRVPDSDGCPEKKHGFLLFVKVVFNKNHQSKTIFTSSIMLNSMSLPCYSEKLSSGDMLKPDPSFRPNPPKVLSRGQNHPPNHLARIYCFLCLFIH